MSDADLCYRALATRDARFDGRFFTGVRSTGVFCRPVCPARTPRRENCTFFPSAAAAQEAGFRPCLRCRPESSPGSPAWAGTHATVDRALRLIGDGALDRAGVEDLAERLGVGGRHLRRLFLRHLGATPVAVASTRRVLFAKKLLDETDLPMTEVACAAGFGSLRRFNDAMRRTYARAPGSLRRRKIGRGQEVAGIRLRLAYRPPLDWEHLTAWMKLRAVPGVEQVGADGWCRSVRVGATRGLVRVVPVAGSPELEARIELEAPASLVGVAERLRRVFDLGADPVRISEALGHDPVLAPRLARAPGVRIPGAWDPFELSVRAILGQQVSVVGATTLAGRLVRSLGEPLASSAGSADVAGSVTHLFPTPEALADADLGAVGLTRARASAIRALARAMAEGSLLLDGARGLDETVEALCALPGIGPWTAHYVALRACGEPDAFPVSDLGLRRALAGEGPPVAPATLAAVAEAWRPWRGYAAMLLWSA